MKAAKNLAIIFLLLISSFSFAQYGAEESRYEQTLTLEYNGVKTKMKITNFSYTLNNYNGYEISPAPARKEPFYMSVTLSDSPTKEVFKIYQNANQTVKGVVEIKDNFGKSPIRKFEFNDASLSLSEYLSSYNTGNTVSLSIYSETLIIDGIAISSK